ncbi:MAG: hypothetical protein SAJ12_14625 [Jaaginema sp. PMC 1079.18]|nr:hypothetical protein [Jaaginema sp. PMC 1080.18]MEC4852219.1 hypothetical protein [Jaaginema sp. PMC 1079.18]
MFVKLRPSDSATYYRDRAPNKRLTFWDLALAVRGKIALERRLL